TQSQTTQIYTLSLHDALPIFQRFGLTEPQDLVGKTLQNRQREVIAAGLQIAGADFPRLGGKAFALGPDLGSVVFANFVIAFQVRSEEHMSELQSRENLVCRLL